MSKELKFDRLKGARRDRDHKTVASQLCAMHSDGPECSDGTLFMLELGCGTKQFDALVERLRGWENRIVVITVDIDESRQPTWVEDITQWRQWLPRRLNSLRKTHADFSNFHYVHFSPKVGKALDLVLHGMMLILDIKPPCWTIECSGSGNQGIMRGLAARLHNITFCKCVDSRGNKKPSAWWCSFPRTLVRKYFQPLVCTADNPCLGRSLQMLYDGGPGRRSASGVPGMKRDDAMAFSRGLVTTILHMVVVWLAHPVKSRDRVMKLDHWRFKATL